MPEIVVQAEIGGMTIAFTGKEEGDIDAQLDLYRRAIDRQRARQELVEALIEMQARRDTLSRYEELRATLLAKRRDERGRLAAAMDIKNQARAQLRRSDEVPRSNEQYQQLQSFDLETQQKLDALAAERERCETELPLYQARIGRCRAIIAGAPREDVIAGAE